jgi:hypothetical protein
MIKSGDKVVIEDGPVNAKGKTGTVVRVASRAKAYGSNGTFVVYIPGRYESVMASRVRKVGKNPVKKYNRKNAVSRRRKYRRGRNPRMATAFKVYLRGKEIDTVFQYDNATAADVKKSLINHDGYDSDITVKKRRFKMPSTLLAKRKQMPNPRRQLSVPEKHQLKVALQTLKYSDVGARIMGGPTKVEAREIIKRLTGRTVKENPSKLTRAQKTLLKHIEWDAERAYKLRKNGNIQHAMNIELAITSKVRQLERQGLADEAFEAETRGQERAM